MKANSREAVLVVTPTQAKAASISVPPWRLTSEVCSVVLSTQDTARESQSSFQGRQAA